MNHYAATNEVLNNKLAELTIVEENGEHKHLLHSGLWIGSDCPNYCSDWNATMPIAVDQGLDIELPTEWLGNIGTITKNVEFGTDIQVDFSHKESSLRAIVICLIKVLESEK